MTLKAFPDLQSLSAYLGRDYRRNVLFLAYVLANARRVREFEIPKRSGGKRRITAPVGPILKLQRELYELAAADYSPKSMAHGFVKGKSIVSNASQHVGKKWVLNFDLQDFFGTISFQRVLGRLKANPYNYSPEVARLVAHLACHRGTLMQGGALSPLLSNMVCDKLDSEISRHCKQFNATYSRYADDITISSNRAAFPSELATVTDLSTPGSATLSPHLADIILHNGFTLQPSKTRLQGYSVRQEVTGVVVNVKRNVPRSFIRQVRCILHACEKFGIDDAAKEHFGKWRRDRGRLPEYEAKDLEWVLRGKIEFVRHVKGKSDPVFQSLAHRFNNLPVTKKFTVVPTASTDVLREAVWVIEGTHRTERVVKYKRRFPALIRIAKLLHLSIDEYYTVIEIQERPYTGSVFFCSDGSILSCAHCYTPGAFIYRPDKPDLKFNVSPHLLDIENDICILELTDFLPATHKPKVLLEKAHSNDIYSLKVGHELQLAGYPANLPANQISIASGQITGFLGEHFKRKLSREERQIVIDRGIIEGQSGGPALRNGKVIGIAIRGPGSESPIEPCVVVQLTALQ
jgi:RNA-directed DNA polymerase